MVGAFSASRLDSVAPLAGPVCIVIPITSWRDAEQWVRGQLASIRIPAGVSIMIVDNGCDDPIEGPPLESKFVTVLRSEVNQGFGGAARLANQAVSQTASLCWMPGNGKISLSDCLDWLTLERKSPNSVAKAVRVGRQGIDKLKSKLVDVFLTTATGSSWLDVGGTPTVISPGLRESFFELAPDGIEIEAFTISFCNQKSIQMSRSTISYGPRAFGNSTWRKGLISEVSLLRAFTKIALTQIKL